MNVNKFYQQLNCFKYLLILLILILYNVSFKMKIFVYKVFPFLWNTILSCFKSFVEKYFVVCCLLFEKE